MKNCALIVSDNREKGIKRSSSNIILASKKVYGTLKTIEIYPQYQVYLIQLIYKNEEILKFKKNKIQKIQYFIHKLCQQNNLAIYMIESDILNKINMQEKIKKDYDSTLYISSVMEIIKRCCLNKNITYADLNATVVAGNNINQLIALLELISQQIKFITVVTEHGQYIASQLENRFGDRGLSIAISVNVNEAIKNSDVLINLGAIEDLDVESIMPQGCVIVNFGILNNAHSHKDIKIVNEINVRLSRYVLSKLGTEILDKFTETQIAEMLLIHKLGLESELSDEKLTATIMCKLMNSIKEIGYIEI